MADIKNKAKAKEKEKEKQSKLMKTALLAYERVILHESDALMWEEARKALMVWRELTSTPQERLKTLAQLQEVISHHMEAYKDYMSEVGELDATEN